MKRPLLSQGERITLRILPDTTTAQFIRLDLANARLKQAIGKTWIIQGLVKPLVEYLSFLLTQKKKEEEG